MAGERAGRRRIGRERRRELTIVESINDTSQLIRVLAMALMVFFMIYRFQIYEFSQLMDDNVEREISSDVTLKIIDIILLNETSLNKPTVCLLILLLN